jgi:hypothetical protein
MVHFLVQSANSTIRLRGFDVTLNRSKDVFCPSIAAPQQGAASTQVALAKNESWFVH